jgi:hypothetical protein
MRSNGTIHHQRNGVNAQPQNNAIYRLPPRQADSNNRRRRLPTLSVHRVADPETQDSPCRPGSTFDWCHVRIDVRPLIRVGERRSLLGDDPARQLGLALDVCFDGINPSAQDCCHLVDLLVVAMMVQDEKMVLTRYFDHAYVFPACPAISFHVQWTRLSMCGAWLSVNITAAAETRPASGVIKVAMWRWGAAGRGRRRRAQTRPQISPAEPSPVDKLHLRFQPAKRLTD